MAELNNRQRATIGGAVVVFLGALIAAAALAQSTRNQSDQTPANGALFAAESPSPSVSVSPSVSLSPSVSVSPSPTASPVPSVSPAVTVTKTVSVTATTLVTTTTRGAGAPHTVNAGTGGQASIGGLSPGAATPGMARGSVLAGGRGPGPAPLGMAGVSVLAVGSALMPRRRKGARL